VFHVEHSRLADLITIAAAVMTGTAKLALRDR